MIRCAMWASSLAGLCVGLLACNEHLTTPGQCPDLCPGGTPVVFDTIITARAGGDESVEGYVARGAGRALLTSNGLPASEDRTIYQFASRLDSIKVRDTSRAYSVDSVQLSLNLVARDSLVPGLRIYLYRLPADLQPDTATFAGVEPQLIEPSLIDSITVPDSVHTGALSTMLRGADADRVAIPVGTGGVLSIGLKIAAASPTGIRVGSLAAGSAATFTTFVTVDVPDTTTSIVHQSLSRGAQANTFVTQNPYTAQPGTLLIGGEPSSRVFLRFDLPPRILDSATIVRATLELIPVIPIPGLANDPAVLVSRSLLSDLGPKSPVTADSTQVTLVLGSSDTVRVEATRAVQLWQAVAERPQALSIKLFPEGATFTRTLFGSTSPQSPVGAPHLRITYLMAFPAESP